MITTRSGASVRSAADVPALGTVLGVWAHPDDEAYLSGGLMALARDAGQRVVCVTATRGELGTSDPDRWPPDRLAAERTGELARCLDILGGPEHRWLGLSDGRCADTDRGLMTDRLCAMITEIRPDTVLTFGPDGTTGHPDHQAVSAWTSAAFRQAAPAGAQLLHSATSDRWAARWGEVNERLGVFQEGYPVVVGTDQLTVDLVLSHATLARKVRALRAQATQTDQIFSAMGADDYAAWVSIESFVRRA